MKKLLLLLACAVGLQTIIPAPQAHADIKDKLLSYGIIGSALITYSAHNVTKQFAANLKRELTQGSCSEQTQKDYDFQCKIRNIAFFSMFAFLAIKYGLKIASLFTSNNSVKST